MDKTENQQWLLREQERELKATKKENKALKKQLAEIAAKHKALDELNDKLGKSITPLKQHKDKIEKLMIKQDEVINEYKVRLAAARMYLTTLLTESKTYTKQEIAENYEKYDLDFVLNGDTITINRVERVLSDAQVDVLHSGATSGEAEGKSDEERTRIYPRSHS